MVALSRVALCFFCVCSVNAADKLTSSINKMETGDFKNLNVSFDIRKTGGALEFIGKMQDEEKLKLQIADSAFSMFTEYMTDNFRISRLNDSLLFQYRSDDYKEALDLMVKQNGNTYFVENDLDYTGWNEHKVFGIRTFGILENRFDKAFYSLVATANQIHNYGTIMAGSIQFSQNYLFNSGVLQLGEIPDKIVNLSILGSNNTATPSYKANTIENYGAFRSGGNISIKGGLHYIERGNSDFDNLETSNGNVSVDPERYMIIGGATAGQICNLTVGNKGILSANSVGFSKLQNINVGDKGVFNSANSYSLTVDGSFANSGKLISGADMTLYLKNAPFTKQQGIVCAKRSLSYSHERNDKPRNSTKAPNITKDPTARAQLLRTAPDPNSAAFKKLQEEFYKRVGYKPEYDNSGHENLENSVPLFSKKIRQTIYTDHYLNTITYHYTVTQDQQGKEVKRELTDVTETGYIFQRRTAETKEITVPEAGDDDKFFDNINSLVVDIRTGNKKKKDAASENMKFLAIKNKVLMYQRFLEALKKAMTGAGVADSDAQILLADPYFNFLANFDNFSQTQQEKLTKENPETVDLIETIDDARYDAQDLTKWLDTPAQKFINELSVPIMVLSMVPQLKGPMTAYKGLQAAVAMAPKLEGMAVAFGAGAAACYKKITTFFNEQFKDGKDEGKADPSSDRIQSTKQDADNYLSGLKEKGVLGNKQTSTDGYEYYEFKQKINYNGVRFRKGDYISRDTLHHEWEWFRGKNVHKGAIESKGGKVREGALDKSRTLKIK
jgi:hypothetical protein